MVSEIDPQTGQGHALQGIIADRPCCAVNISARRCDATAKLPVGTKRAMKLGTRGRPNAVVVKKNVVKKNKDPNHRLPRWSGSGTKKRDSSPTPGEESRLYCARSGCTNSASGKSFPSDQLATRFSFLVVLPIIQRTSTASSTDEICKTRVSPVRSNISRAKFEGLTSFS